jgi:hypothetical protein
MCSAGSFAGQGVEVSRVPRWGYGSKRRIQLIRWNRYQIAGIVLLAFSLMLLGFFLARLLASFEMHEREKQESALKHLRPIDISFSESRALPRKGNDTRRVTGYYSESFPWDRFHLEDHPQCTLSPANLLYFNHESTKPPPIPSKRSETSFT